MENRGRFHGREKLWEQMYLVKLGVLLSKNQWYTGIGCGFQLHCCDLKSHFGESNQHFILEQIAGDTLVNMNALCYIVLLRKRPDAMLAVDVICSLVFMVEWLVR